ncbi:hypothetical protein [Paracoccus shanxieyensis]|uniref:hypothetical protein n=1 Tax=Paracoccus shanxieyensis TaxID=2675752 RepID=UPI0012BA0686|nr:hypothetical protein [Paracoccus shanxieyensis]MTH86528.1 hypothetical protein [Paracoccus shanxieyensis]
MPELDCAHKRCNASGHPTGGCFLLAENRRLTNWFVQDRGFGQAVTQRSLAEGRALRGARHAMHYGDNPDYVTISLYAEDIAVAPIILWAKNSSQGIGECQRTR